MKVATPRDVRNELLERLRAELVGPNEEHEELAERPGHRYLCGILWPMHSTVDVTEDETDIATGSEDEQDGSMDLTAPISQSMKPSSIGLSFVVDKGCTEVRVTASWATYERIQVEGRKERDGSRKGNGKDKEVRWRRKPDGYDIIIPLIPDGRYRQYPSDDRADEHGTPQVKVLSGGEHGGKEPSSVRVQIEWLARDLQGRTAVSLFLVNRTPKSENEQEPEDTRCLFQPVITVAGTHPGQPIFVSREVELPEGLIRPADVLQDDLLYRHERTFAVGHGTAVDWEVAAGQPDRATRLWTITIPAYEVPRVIASSAASGAVLDMDKLAEAPNGDTLHAYLNPLLEAYEQWIEERQQELDRLASELSPDLVQRGQEHLDACRRSLARMKSGLHRITTDPVAFAAFKFANRAMALQRQHTVWARKARKTQTWTSGPEPIRSTWRPFQMAFILQSILGLVEPTHKDRQIADLLWFPTGGGKTEAYLGLAAFLMGYRRLRGEWNGRRGDAGVAIIMRYTLRLLTIQQFQRAAALICACEIIRQENPDQWGHEPFRIGLWVGDRTTPNTYDECKTALQDVHHVGATPVQLLACPWCGAPLERAQYHLVDRLRRLIVSCSRKECEFHRLNNPEGLPVLLDDEEIYRLLPTMLIGTVDKFARLPWRGEAGALFGEVKGWVKGWGFVAIGEDSRTAFARQEVLRNQGLAPDTISDTRRPIPPELIIQDELHLISGPLGTVVGAYETAVDFLSSQEINGQLVGPKIIASTATIRKADEQVRALFERQVAIFPPPGLDARDSFFARQQPLDEAPGRLYVGVFAPGRSVKTALVRVYATLLASVGAIQAPPEAIDPYYTLVGYFNSLRELGGALRLLEDDIPSWIAHPLSNEHRLGQRYKFVRRHLNIGDGVPELTSRVPSRNIPEILDKLERSFTGRNQVERPVDVVLASNMISVGVDVTRLGLMVVTGQPKTTAEYIQATSRVGREHPGLVVTVYNWARPRDRSHYERFRSYHAALYRYVEAISVTPFSSRARDRALAGVFITMCRHRVRNLARNRDARYFRATEETVHAIRERILRRVQAVDITLPQSEVEQELQRIAETWDEAARQGELVYTGVPEAPHLIYPLGEKKQRNGLFPLPNSMRNVEAPVGLYLVGEERR